MKNPTADALVKRLGFARTITRFWKSVNRGVGGAPNACARAITTGGRGYLVAGANFSAEKDNLQYNAE